jgi:hypothetical protein
MILRGRRAAESFTHRSGLGSWMDCSGSHSGNEEGGSVMTCRKHTGDPPNWRLGSGMVAGFTVNLVPPR